jgi:hypothetical protein
MESWLAVANPLDEPDVRCVDVQHADTARAGVAKAVGDALRHRDVGARAGADRSALDEELDFSLEHVERVDVIIVAVRLNPLPVSLEAELDRLELGQLGEYAMARHARALEPLTLAGPDHDRTAHVSR